MWAGDMRELTTKIFRSPWHIPWQSFNLSQPASNIFSSDESNTNAGRVAFLATFQVWFIFHGLLPVRAFCIKMKTWSDASRYIILEFSTIGMNFHSRADKLTSHSRIETAEFRKKMLFLNEKCCPVTLKIYRPLVSPPLYIMRNHSIHSCESILIDEVQFNSLLFDYWLRVHVRVQLGDRSRAVTTTITLK